MTSFKTIHLHGPMAHLLNGPFRCAADTIEQALNALGRQVKGLTPVPGQHQIAYEIVGLECAEDLFRPCAMEEIHLVPVMGGGGGGGGGFLGIVLGVALIAFAWWNPLSWGMLAIGMIASVGVSLVLGGLMSLMSSPTPNAMPSLMQDNNFETTKDPESSRYLGSNKNSVKIGTRVSICFGRCKVPGHFVSFNVDSTEGVDTAYNPVVLSSDPDIAPDGSSHWQPTMVYA